MPALVRPTTLVWAVALNILVGVSGIAAGLPLVGGFLGGGLNPFQPTGRDVLVFGLIAFGVLGYGVLAIIGAIGTWLGSRPGWSLALGVDLVGLAILGWTVALTSLSDELLLGGLGLWAVMIALLIASPTRAALRS